MGSPAVGIIVQARVGSTRLPHKVLRQLCGRALICQVLQRLQISSAANLLIVALPTGAADDVLEDCCRTTGVRVYRGSEKDVLERYFECAGAFGLSHIVRVTGDNPLVDWEELDRLVELHVAQRTDYTSSKNEEVGSGLPYGVGAEVFTFAALERAFTESSLPAHREHVNEFITDNPSSFRMAALMAPPPKRAPDLCLTVDTPQDFGRLAMIYEHFGGEHLAMTTEAVIEYCMSQGVGERGEL